MKINSFKNRMQSGYWTNGSVWEFDWYIDCFFVEVMAYGKNPVKLGYMQAILGDKFTKFKYDDLIKQEFKGFLYDKVKTNKLLESQNEILKSARLQIKLLKSNKFSASEYKKVQSDLSLLMASVSVVFDDLMPDVISQISSRTRIPPERISGYIIEKSSKTKLNESNLKLLSIYNKNKVNFIKSKFKYSDLDDTIQEEIKKHSIKYNWLNTGERGGKPWTAEELLGHLEQLVNKKWNGSKKSSIKVDNSSNDLINVLIGINVNDNVAADLQVELDWHFQNYLRNQLKDLYIEPIIENLTYEEILSILEKPNSIFIYLNRKNNQYRVVWPENGKINFHYFKRKEDFQKIQKMVQDEPMPSEIKGTVACRGIAEGRVRLIEKQSDIHNFIEGEVLVASKTQPSYVVIMNKAAAIVTDVGGVTSHAAIISREFNVPCIVATKNATRFFKNGDLVFVDANAGTVKKLE